MTDQKQFHVELRSKRDLIFHTYGVFLERQTRLAYGSKLIGIQAWEDIDQRRKSLMIDDITSFSIAGRRLIDLCKLQSFTDSLKIRQVRLVRSGRDLNTPYSDEKQIGFYSLLSRLIHMSYFFYYDSKREFRFAVNSDLVTRYEEYVNASLENDNIDGFILTRENKHPAIVIKLVDVVSHSINAAERIIEVCSRAGIELETFDKDT